MIFKELDSTKIKKQTNERKERYPPIICCVRRSRCLAPSSKTIRKLRDNCQIRFSFKSKGITIFLVTTLKRMVIPGKVNLEGKEKLRN